MKKLFELLAAYNTETNREMLQILGELPEKEVEKSRGSFFGSILFFATATPRGISWRKRLFDILIWKF